MPHPGKAVHIPLETDTAIGLLLRVKPTKDMPRPGTNRQKSIVAEANEEFGPITPKKRTKKA